ncbi:hypothetical protein H2248_002227 [Termitomyces sp. 'cryptogamus']|nr:hypothetical protein H2248_002227 [Termitomyces sp. 'cryptogamus']
MSLSLSLRSYQRCCDCKQSKALDYDLLLSSSFLYVSPFGLIQDLISAALRILQDQDLGGLFDDRPKRARSIPGGVLPPAKPRGLLMNFVLRFVLGLLNGLDVEPSW